jgi:ParD-like antitoxin of type II bacterial toxin-antitoxin system
VATTSPARIDDQLYASAKLAGEVQSRSASQQVVHWARIGREIEASASIGLKEVAEVLAGSRSYDTLSAKEQAVVRAEWSDRMDNLRATANLAKEFTAAGRRWVEVDDDGRIVEMDGASKPSRSERVTKAKPAATSGRTRRIRKMAGSDKPARAVGARTAAGLKARNLSGPKARTQAAK